VKNFFKAASFPSQLTPELSSSFLFLLLATKMYRFFAISSMRNKKLVLSQKRANFFSLRFSLHLLDSVESITHDSDKQVQKNNLQEDRADEKENPIERRCIAVIIAIDS